MTKLTAISFAAAIGLLLAGCGGGQKAPADQYKLITDDEASVTETTSGKVAGYIDRGIYVYKGIPYAKAGRFEEPQDPDPWEGIRSSRAYGPTAPQAFRTGWYSDQAAFSSNWDDGFAGEDCQRVNIWTPSRSGKRAVMVWLHGGGYAAGSGQEQPCYDGLNLAKNHDVVVVTLNHRLNVLGYLDLSSFGEKYKHSANLGMMDIVKALQWVHDNIASFGGDPSNVMIFGQSGGGGKVSTLLATPSAKGLFNKAVVESGGANLTMKTPEQSRPYGEATVRELGLTAATIDKIKEVPYAELLSAANAGAAKVLAASGQPAGRFGAGFPAGPVMDGDFIPYQPGSPEGMAISKDIPVMNGTTRTEFAYGVPEDVKTPEGLDKYLNSVYGASKDAVIEAFKKDYPDEPLENLCYADFLFRPGAVQQAEARVKAGCAPVYNYIFRWESPVMGGILRSSHCMEIPFVFDNVALQNEETGGADVDIELGHRISSLWANFAKTGVPSAEGMPEWKPFTLENKECMMLDTKSEVRNNPDGDLLKVATTSLF